MRRTTLALALGVARDGGRRARVDVRSAPGVRMGTARAIRGISVERWVFSYRAVLNTNKTVFCGFDGLFFLPLGEEASEAQGP